MAVMTAAEDTGTGREAKLLEIRDITIVLQGKEILKDITLQAYDSGITMILGLNGAGKTTLFRAIAGILRPEKGDILLNGSSLLTLKPRERAKKVAYCMQNTEGEPDAAAKDYVLTGVTPYLGVFAYHADRYAAEAQKALEQFSAGHLSDCPMSQLSGGEQQRIYLARTFMQHTDVLLMDEPTANLDFKAQEEFLRSLKGYVKDKQKIALMTVHDPNIALRYADSIICLQEGRVMEILHREESDRMPKAESCLRRLYGDGIKVKYDKQYYVGWEQGE